MAGLHCIVVVISEDVQEGEVAGINPSSSLDHQLFVGFHRVRVGDCIRDVLQVESSVLLAVYAQTEDSVLGQVHVGLSVVSFLVVGVQYHLEVFSLQQILLEFLAVDQGLIAIA